MNKMWEEKECPICKEEFEVNGDRWNGKTECPHCQTWLLWDFDFIVLEDGDE